jgi:hypothetical protein
MRSIALVALIALATACKGEPEDSAEETDTSALEGEMTSGGTWRLTLVHATEPPPVAEETSATVHIFGGDAHTTPVTDADLAVEFTMPAHNHGMATTPQVTNNADGTYTIDGILYQMSGEWRADLEVSLGATSESLSLTVEID